MDTDKGKHLRKKTLNCFECWQINLHRCKAASYNMSEVTKKMHTGLLLVQEPWTYKEIIRGRPRGWNLWQGSAVGGRPRSCIYSTPNLQCSLVAMFSDEDVVALRVKNVCQKNDEFIFVSAYMANEESAPPRSLRELIDFAEKERIPTIIGTDANAHHTIWGSSNTNKRGEELLDFCASANVNFCNVGNKPTFVTRKRNEVLDLTLVNRNALDRVCDWHVSDVPSLSDHLYIRFKIKNSPKNQPK